MDSDCSTWRQWCRYQICLYVRVNLCQLRRIFKKFWEYIPQGRKFHESGIRFTRGVWQNDLHLGGEGSSGMMYPSAKACGNTVRNVTASELAGIDQRTLLNVKRLYADATFSIFWEKPCLPGNGGRKVPKWLSSFCNEDKHWVTSWILGFHSRSLRNRWTSTVRRLQTSPSLEWRLGIAKPPNADAVHKFLKWIQLDSNLSSFLRIFDDWRACRRIKPEWRFLVKGLGLDLLF